MQTDELDGLKGDDKIVAEAKGRFERCQKYEAVARERGIQDDKFANADSDNGWQWPNDLMKSRIDMDKPSLTINKTRQHNNQIINDALQNKAAVKVRPTGDGASFQAAEVREGIIRHIEYISRAQDAYATAITHQVDIGKGYVRVVTDYADNDSFDQEIFIRRVKDWLSVFIDPDCNELDKSDARFAFIFEDVAKDEFVRDYPELKFDTPRTALDNTDTWLTDKHIRVAEYYRINERKDVLIAYKDEQGNQKTIRKSKVGKDIAQALLDNKEAQKRDIIRREIEWYKIAGDKIIDRRVEDECVPGPYIPIVPFIGTEYVIEGIMDCKGHTRALKDPQRMYNYNSSASVEYGALQTKSPWTAPAQAIEGFEDTWREANVKNYSVLPWNHVDDDGNPIPAPERLAPPQGAQFYVEEREASNQDMMMVSGQYQDSLGQQSNAVSGKAINQRERQGDKATYHFDEGQARAIRQLGRIIMEWIPKIYDTKRIMKILAEDGTESEIMIDPQAKQAYQQQQQQEKEVVAGIFNPSIGKYDVEADVGPAYATRRQEAWNAITQILTQSSELTPIIGDLLFKNGDFPGADEIAERLKRMVPPQALGEGAPPQVAQMQEQMQNLSKMLEKALQELAAEKLKYKGKDMQKDIDAYDSITRRMEALFKHVTPTPKDKEKMLHEIMLQEHESNLNMVEADAQHGMNMELAANAPEASNGQTT